MNSDNFEKLSNDNSNNVTLKSQRTSGSGFVSQDNLRHNFTEFNSDCGLWSQLMNQHDI